MSRVYCTYDAVRSDSAGKSRARHGMPWTKDEKAELYQLFKLGRTAGSIANALERPLSGLLSKLEDAGYITQNDGCYGDYYFATLEPKQPKQPKEPVMAKAPVIQTKTFIHGEDAAEMTDREIFSKIATMEAEIKSLEAIQTKPTKLTLLIDKMKADIGALVKYVDERP